MYVYIHFLDCVNFYVVQKNQLIDVLYISCSKCLGNHLGNLDNHLRWSYISRKLQVYLS